MTDKPRFALDTSAAVPLLVASHEAHEVVRTWVAGREVGISGHALMETYSVLTRLPGDARLSPSDAVLLIDDNFVEHFVLSADGAAEAHRHLASAGVAGGAAYDGLVALAARDHDAVLVTRDARARPTYESIGARVAVIVDWGEPT
ncbi:PIN domain-containing protein [Gordonia sp. CPCC 205515]|uniref:PIN domain-containing protein n=1 Tax=Gordonia sp. CPCC 205515 TaxID=3140791 RepID=UPI003AF3F779